MTERDVSHGLDDFQSVDLMQQASFWEDFDEEYIVEFLAPVICLGLTLCSIIVELY